MNRLHSAARDALAALVQVLTGPEAAPPGLPGLPGLPGSSTAGPGRPARVVQVVLAVATALLAVGNAVHVRASDGGQAGPGLLLVAVAVVLPLLLAAWQPLRAWRIGWLGLLLTPLLPAEWWGGWPWGAPQVVALLVVFCLAGVRRRRAELWWMWGLSLLPWCWWLVVDIANLNGPASATLIFTAVTVAVGSLGAQSRTEHALVGQTERTDAERARRAVLEERARIARELHDVVAHHLSLIAVQAETAPFRLGELPDPVGAEFASLSGVAREALTEMRRLLGVLRQDQSAALAPQPQLADLPALVDAARRAGVTVDLAAPPQLGRVPAGVGVCAYRVVQESLSNATRHAPGAAVAVTVRQDQHEVRIRVANGPSVPSRSSGRTADAARDRSPEAHGGHGLAGMRERVALLGGSLSAEPTATGGFEVSAVLPLGEAV